MEKLPFTIKATFFSVLLIYNPCFNLCSEIYKSSCRNYALFKISDIDHKLDVGADKISAVASFSHCAQLCLKKESCKTTNYNPNSLECELLNASKSNGGSLIASVGWNHYEPFNMKHIPRCDRNTCAKNHACSERCNGDLEYKCKPCFNILTDRSGEIRTPRDANGYYPISCNYVIKQPTGFQITITFSSFDLESSSSCVDDFVKVYDGESTSAKLINGQGYCGSSIPPTITSSGNNLYITFKTNGKTAQTGFVLSYTACYDKLKPYGFPIHGAIDGYSRKILWLEVARSNNNPEFPARYYLDFVVENSGCPILVRTDNGSENGIMAGMQRYARQNGTYEFAGEKSHKYGTSPSNQRIEAWWSFLRKGKTSWWMDFFKDMIASGIVEVGNELHMECLWFCFQSVLQDELDKVKTHWNTHRIRKSKYGTVSGVPDVLYFLPERSGGDECIVLIEQHTINEMEEYLQTEESSNSNNTVIENDYQEYFHYVIDNSDLQFPAGVTEAFELFQQLIRIAEST